MVSSTRSGKRSSITRPARTAHSSGGQLRLSTGLRVTSRVGDDVVRVGNTRLVTKADRTAPGDGGSSAVHVAIGDRYTGSILVADTVRDSALQCVADLLGLGLHLILITGDATETAQKVAEEVGIGEVHAEPLPADKVDRVDALRAAGRTVAMVGGRRERCTFPRPGRRRHRHEPAPTSPARPPTSS